MEWTTPPVVPASPPAPVAIASAIEPTDATSNGSGLRRTVLTAALSALLLVGGAAAVVSAASPEPSAAPSTTAPAGGSGTQPAPRQHGTGSTADCPNMGGASGSGNGSGTAPTAPTTPTVPAPTPAT